jgi:hypothetical protein
MKVYIKPKIDYVKLTAQEKYASGSCVRVYLEPGECPAYWDTLNVS